MVSRLLKIGWRAKSKVPTAEYAAMLSSALATIAKPEGLDQHERTQFLAHIQRLESIAPEDSRLTDMHIRAVGYLRGYLKIQDLTATWQAKRKAGKTKEASRDFAELKRWDATVHKVRGEFIQSKQALKTHHPTLYEQLSLPAYFR